MSSQNFSTFTEVGMIDARTLNGSITLPLTTDIPYRILTLKDIYGAVGVSTVTLQTQGSDTFEDGTTTRQLTNPYETMTLYAGQTGYWYIIGGSRLNAAAIGTLSVGVIQAPLQVGTISTMSQIVFPGLSTNYNATAILEASTGTGTQELLLFKGSTTSDRIRMQTTGNIVFEAGVGARTYLGAISNATPTMVINASSNVGIGLTAAAIGSLLDVGGQGRFITVSTQQVATSTVTANALNLLDSSNQIPYSLKVSSALLYFSSFAIGGSRVMPPQTFTF
jgi:hypothetical protein